MDKLRELASQDESSDHVGYTEAGEPILTPDIINIWAKEMGFRDGKKGTFHNDDTYVYVKGEHKVGDEADVDQTLALARELTSLGAIHPASRWGVFRTDEGEYQLFAVSPRLEAWQLEKELLGSYKERPARPVQDEAHITKWLQRIDADYTPDQPVPEGSLVSFLNRAEASNPDNWGWDEDGRLFPVDVEVIDFHPVSFL